MSKNRFFDFFRAFFSFGSPKATGKEMNAHDEMYNHEPVNENLQIHVDDRTPDFLKPQNEDDTLPKTEVRTKEEKVSQKEDAVIETPDIKPEDPINDNPPIEPEPEPEPEPKPESLLDNKPLVKMFEECADVIKYLEHIRPAFDSENGQDLINTVREQLLQAMVLSGGKTIDNETHFNILRHQCLKGIHANDGDEIIKTLEPGVSLEERVLVKAIVETKTEG